MDIFLSGKKCIENPMLIRTETEKDWDDVYAINASAFETSAEADLVDGL